jgi:uncharacterized protein with HEPN domain
MKDDGVYLRHILDAIGKIESYVAVGRDVFMSASHWQDAVIRQLEIVGEATKNLSPDFRSRYSDIPWRRIAGLRDVLKSVRELRLSCFLFNNIPGSSA